MILASRGAPLWRSLLALLLFCALAPAVRAQVNIAGKVLNGGASGIDGVIVTLHLSDGTQPSCPPTKRDGKYAFNLATKGQVMWIEFSKPGTGYREIHDLSEGTDQNISIVLGKTPNNYAAVVVRQTEIDRLLLRARFSEKDLSEGAKAFLKSDQFKKEIKQLPEIKVEMPKDARTLLQQKADEQLFHLSKIQ